MSKPLRILYAAGPGDVIGTYNYWVKGQDDPSQIAITYSAQFYKVCTDLDVEGYLISSNSRRDCLRDARFLIEHRPVPWRNGPSYFYHLGQVLYGLRLIISAIRYRADVVVVVEGSTHLFIMSLLPWLGIKVVPLLQCVLWCKFRPISRLNRLIWRLSRNLFAQGCFATVTVSDDISKQVAQITGDKHRPIIRIFPNYRRTQFAGIDEPEESHIPFRVLFVGRIEKNKGVFDLLEIAKQFAFSGRQDIKFDVCGKGTMLESLRLAAREAGVSSSFVCHGHCDKTKMHQMFSHAHVVMVPTRTDFVEGFNKVVVEGILSGRPVVTSKVCPALSDVMDAVVEVPPDDIKGYGEALLKLCDDRNFYEQKRQACWVLQERFYDTSLSWEAALKSILLAILEDREISNI